MGSEWTQLLAPTPIQSNMTRLPIEYVVTNQPPTCDQEHAASAAPSMQRRALNAPGRRGVRHATQGDRSLLKVEDYER